MANQKLNDSHTFLVLSVKDGLGFSHYKNKLSKVLVVLEGIVMSSDYIFTSSNPTFNCHFTWRIENSLLSKLCKLRKHILVELRIFFSSNLDYSGGFARIAISQAERLENSSVTPRYVCLEFSEVKGTWRYRNPQIFVSLTIQTVLRLRSNEECHNVDIKEENGKLIAVHPKKAFSFSPDYDKSKHISTNINKHQKPSKFQQKCNKPLVKEKSKVAHKSAEKLEIPTGETKKCQLKKADTVPNLFKKKLQVQEKQKSTVHAGNVKDKLQSSAKPYSASCPKKVIQSVGSQKKKSEAASVKPKVLGDHLEHSNKITDFENEYTCSNEEERHLYKLEITMKTLHWYTIPKYKEVLLRFYNPSNNSLISLEKENHQIPSLVLSDVICYMHYVCIPNWLLETVLRYRPHILIVDKENDQILVKGILEVMNLIHEPLTDYFYSYMHLITPNDVVVGKINVSVKFEDLGVIYHNGKKYAKDSVVKLKKVVGSEMDKTSSVNDITKEVERLSHVLAKMQDKYKDINTCFQKIAEMNLKQFNTTHPTADVAGKNVVQIEEKEEIVLCRSCNQRYYVKSKDRQDTKNQQNLAEKQGSPILISHLMQEIKLYRRTTGYNKQKETADEEKENDHLQSEGEQKKSRRRRCEACQALDKKKSSSKQ